jgi:hypothetical protein
MVYHRNWEEFAKEAKKLYEDKPDKARSRRPSIPLSMLTRRQVRYCTRWRHKDGLLVLKITDDVQVPPSACGETTSR